MYAPVGLPAGAGRAHCCCRTRTAVPAAGYVTQHRSHKRSLNASQLHTLESDPQDVTSPDMRMQHPALALTWPCCSGLAALSMLFGRHASSTTAQHEGAQKSGHTEHGQHAVRGRSRVCSARACHGLHAVRNAGHGQRFATPGHCALAGVGRQDACPTRPWHCLHTLTDAAAAALAACACSCAAAQTGWHVHRNAAAKAGHCPASQGCAGSGELRARFQGIGQPQRHSWSNRPSTAAPSSSITSAASMERPRR